MINKAQITEIAKKYRVKTWYLRAFCEKNAIPLERQWITPSGKRPVIWIADYPLFLKLWEASFTPITPNQTQS